MNISILFQIFVRLLIHVKMVVDAHRLVLIINVTVQVQVIRVQFVLMLYPQVSFEKNNYVFSDL